MLWSLGRHQLADRFEHHTELSIVFFLQFGELPGQLFMLKEELAQPHECSNHEHADFDSYGRIQHAGEHYGAVLRKGVWERRRILEGMEVVAVCDHLVLFHLSAGA